MPFRLRLPRLDRGGQHLALMLALTFSTGVIDAVGYLGLDRVFTANMTGNVVILGMALTGAEGLPVSGPLVALAAFFAGAVIAGRALRGVPDGWSGRATGLLAVVAAALGGAAVVAGVAPDPRALPIALPVTAVISAAMGAQAGAARHLAVKDIPTVVVTSTLVGLAFESRLGKAVPQPWVRRLLALVFIGAGAVLGALLLTVGLALGIAVTAAVILVVAVLGHFTRTRRDPLDAAPLATTGASS